MPDVQVLLITMTITEIRLVLQQRRLVVVPAQTERTTIVIQPVQHLME